VNAPVGDVAGNLLDDSVWHEHQAERLWQPRFQTQLIIHDAVIAARPED
jgi:hypothetical protein